MDQYQINEILSDRRGGPGVALLRALLLPASWGYSAVVRLRRWAYRCEILPHRIAKVPVISVGNLTTGGTGKTPMVAWIAGRLKNLGARPTILTRGYKCSGGVSDEAELLKQLTDCPVVINPDRFVGAESAMINSPDVLIMDDGFQHRRLHRDLDVVLIDAAEPFGYGHCLPRGLLREPPSALKDAHAIVITRSDTVTPEQLQRLGNRIVQMGLSASLHAAVHTPVSFVDQDGGEIPLTEVQGRKIYGFCGIANPGSFFQVLRDLGASLLDHRIFDDHVVYAPKTIDDLRNAAQSCDAEILVTTEKDFVKLVGVDFSKALWRLKVEIQIVDGETELIEKLRRTLTSE